MIMRPKLWKYGGSQRGLDRFMSILTSPDGEVLVLSLEKERQRPITGAYKRMGEYKSSMGRIPREKISKSS